LLRAQESGLDIDIGAIFMTELIHFRKVAPGGIRQVRGDFLSIFAARISALAAMRIGDSRWRCAAPPIRDLPLISVRQRANFCHAFTWPNPDLTAAVRSASGEFVGEVTYAVSPLQDRVYVFDIQVEALLRRRAYGLAMLHWLTTTYDMPITPIKELLGAKPFWNEARRLSQKNFTITAGLAVFQMQSEAARWGHLKNEAHRLIQMRARQSETWSLSAEELGR
jgi:hypothetical protein